MKTNPTPVPEKVKGSESETFKNVKWEDEWKLKFNDVLNRMYSLEIKPHIQSLVNVRLSEEAGFALYQSDELEEFISQQKSQSFEEGYLKALKDVERELIKRQHNSVQWILDPNTKEGGWLEELRKGKS